jgi:membrane protein
MALPKHPIFVAGGVRATGPPGRSERPEVSPWTLGGLSVRALAVRVVNEIWVDEISDRAAAMSYYFLFALFPTLLFLTTLIGMLSVGDVMDRLLQYAHDVLPADAASLLHRTLGEIQEGARRGLLSISAVAALWGASRGVQSIITTLNVVYAVKTPRPWWRRQLVALVLTVSFTLFTLGALLSLVFGERIGLALAAWVGLGGAFTITWSVAQWPLGLLFVLTGIDLIYHLAPAVRQRWYWLTPGSTFAVLSWLVASLTLRLYVTYFGSYNATYGSIGGVILLLLWFYVSGLALLVGGEINSVIAQAAAERGERIATPLEDEAESRSLPAAL